MCTSSWKSRRVWRPRRFWRRCRLIGPRSFEASQSLGNHPDPADSGKPSRIGAESASTYGRCRRAPMLIFLVVAHLHLETTTRCFLGKPLQEMLKRIRCIGSPPRETGGPPLKIPTAQNRSPRKTHKTFKMWVRFHNSCRTTKPRQKITFRPGSNERFFFFASPPHCLTDLSEITFARETGCPNEEIPARPTASRTEPHQQFLASSHAAPAVSRRRRSSL